MYTCSFYCCTTSFRNGRGVFKYCFWRR